MQLKRRFSPFLLLLAALAFGSNVWLNAQEPEAGGGRSAVLLTVQDAIGPATSDYISQGIEHARDTNASLVVLELDTPGGLDTSMRSIIQSILESPVPVTTYVSPPGARAASAGTYILYASHFAAMAPGTNTGAATPVAIGGGGTPSLPDDDSGTGDEDANGGDEAAEDGETSEGEAETDGESEPAPQPSTASERKAVNDAVAYLQSLAQLRGRNAEWGERAVRSGASISADAALRNNVIDIVASDLGDLLEQLDGRTTMAGGEEITLDTGGLTYDRVEPNWRTQLLAVLTNPTVAYMLMLLGIYGLIFEGYNPGAIVPGVVGAISLLLALFAFQILPVNYAGLALILLGIILIVGELLVPSFGALGMGGIAAFVLGSIILIDTDVPGFGISMPVITTLATAGALMLLGIVWVAMQARNRPVVSGNEEMSVGRAEAIETFEREGMVWAHGERWRARSTVPVRKGQSLRVIRIEGLLLHVEPIDEPVHQ